MSNTIAEIRSVVLRYSVPVFTVAVAQVLAHRFWPQAAETAALSLFFAAVMTSAWYGGSGPGLLASALALISNNFFDPPVNSPPQEPGIHLLQIAGFLFAALLISLLNGIRKRQKGELAESLAHVKLLGGLLPICSTCKMIRDDEGRWSQIEAYISQHSEATFTHGVCPDCYAKLYPESYERYKQKILQAES